MKVIRTRNGEPVYRRGPRRLKTVRILPTLFTLGNLLCGFAAVYFGFKAMYDFGRNVSAGEVLTANNQLLEQMFPSFISIGAGLILAGIIFDIFDGMIARLTRSTTDFGGQLDSLADVVTCGVAPAILVLALMSRELVALNVNLSPTSGHMLGRLVWVSAAVYVACAAIRLARFNVEHAEVDFDPTMFRGLPSPGAAIIVVAFLIFHEQAAREGGVAIPPDHVLAAIPPGVLAYFVPALMISSGLLMVSRVPYRKLSASLRSRRPFWQLIGVLLLFVVFWSFKAFLLTCFAVLYGVSGPIRQLIRLRRPHRVAHATSTGAPPESSVKTG